VRIFHHKTGEHVWLPLEQSGQRFYPELEDWLSQLPRLGVPIVLLNAQRGGVRPYSESYADHLVQKARRTAGLPSHVTLAACRHGGMTELGDAQLGPPDATGCTRLCEAHRTSAVGRDRAAATLP
jgi:hypothetical protein